MCAEVCMYARVCACVYVGGGRLGQPMSSGLSFLPNMRVRTMACEAGQVTRRTRSLMATHSSCSRLESRTPKFTSTWNLKT